MAASAVHMAGSSFPHPVPDSNITLMYSFSSNRDAQPVDLGAYAAHLPGSFLMQCPYALSCRRPAC